MTHSLFAVIFWIRTIIINMIIIGLGLIYSKGLGSVLFVFLILIAAVLLTFPLLVLIVQAVKISRQLPYVLQARFAWLLFMLVIISIFFYAIMGLPLNCTIFQVKSELSYYLLGTIISILCAGLFSKKSFKSLIIRYEQHLV